MLAPSKHVLFEYESLLVKMSEDNPRNTLTKTNYGLFCDYDIVLGLKCVLPCWSWCKVCQRCSKLGRLLIKLIVCDLYTMYVDLHEKYDNPLISNLQHLGKPYL